MVHQKFFSFLFFLEAHRWSFPPNSSQTQIIACSACCMDCRWRRPPQESHKTARLNQTPSFRWHLLLLVTTANGSKDLAAITLRSWSIHSQCLHSPSLPDQSCPGCESWGPFFLWVQPNAPNRLSWFFWACRAWQASISASDLYHHKVVIGWSSNHLFVQYTRPKVKRHKVYLWLPA